MMKIRIAMKKVLPWLALSIVLASAVLAVFSGFGSRLHWWPFRTGFKILKVSAYAGATGAILAAAAFSLDGLGSRRRTFFAALAGLITFGVPLLWFLTAKK